MTYVGFGSLKMWACFVVWVAATFRKDAVRHQRTNRTLNLKATKSCEISETPNQATRRQTPQPRVLSNSAVITWNVATLCGGYRTVPTAHCKHRLHSWRLRPLTVPVKMSVAVGVVQNPYWCTCDSYTPLLFVLYCLIISCTSNRLHAATDDPLSIAVLGF